MKKTESSGNGLTARNGVAVDENETTATGAESVAKGRDGEGANSAPMSIVLPERKEQKLKLRIRGVSPLIIHAWSAKAVKMMLDKQTGKASAGRGKKDPVQDFRESLYVLPNDAGYGFPAPGFKAAIVSAANDVDLKMTEIKRALHVQHYLVPILAPELARENYTEYDIENEKELKKEHAKGCSMRMDMVRLESGVADIRFRGCFPVWEAELELSFNKAVLTAEQVANLVEAAGYGCGIGEWRPSSPNVRSGEFGRFTIAC